jgi:hypothetical protein
MGGEVPMTKFVGVAGLAGAGKDTTAQALVYWLNRRGISARIERFAYPLKKAAELVFGPDFDRRSEKERVREVFFDNPTHMRPFGSNSVRVGHAMTNLLLSTGTQMRGGYTGSLSPRQYQQFLGDAAKLAGGRDIYCRMLRERATANPCEVVIVPDARFEFELKMCDYAIFVDTHNTPPDRESTHASEHLAIDTQNWVNGCREWPLTDPPPYRFDFWLSNPVEHWNTSILDDLVKRAVNHIVTDLNLVGDHVRPPYPTLTAN